MGRKNLILVLTIVVIAAVVLIAGLSVKNNSHPGSAAATPQPGTQTLELIPSASAETTDDPQPRPTLPPAESYLLVTTQNGCYEPIPLVEEASFKLRQGDDFENVIHVGKNYFRMESSNCDNQDCVGQGDVTLENKDTRILFNMVICLPHQVTLEMLTPEEAQTVLDQIYDAQESYKAAAAEIQPDETAQQSAEEKTDAAQ